MSFVKLARSKKFIFGLFAGGLIIFVGAFLLWWFNVQTQPSRVFDGMLAQSLRTSGVVLTAEQAESEAEAEIEYNLQYSFGATNMAHSITSIKQPGASVTTEMIGTQDADYTRYTHISTTETASDGQPLDISNIENIWAKTPRHEQSGSLLAQAALGLNVPFGAQPVPIGNISNPEHRAALLQKMQGNTIYDVDYANIKKENIAGRKHYTYPVKLQVIPYANLMKQFSEYAGLDSLKDLDPNSFSGTPPIELKMTVDVRSRHLVGVELTTQGQMYRQTFSAYDVPVRVDLPDETISGAELQQRLQEIN